MLPDPHVIPLYSPSSPRPLSGWLHSLSENPAKVEVTFNAYHKCACHHHDHRYHHSHHHHDYHRHHHHPDHQRHQHCYVMNRSSLKVTRSPIQIGPMLQ